MTPSRIVLLGPQFHVPTVGAVLGDLGIGGPVATITAGWQEWESEDAALRRQLGGRAVPLELYRRAERVWAADPELRAEHGRVQKDLRDLRSLYNRRLEHAADAWMELLEDDGPQHLVGPERDAALEAIQRIDARHLDRILELKTDFARRMSLVERPAIVRERAEIAALMERCAAVVIEGGHAAVLRNRLELFDVPALFGDRPLVGCAAGAMVLCNRVVLYNDSPAIGRGHAEVGLAGFGLAPDLAVFPDASTRLRLSDPMRMRRLALRLAPDRCVLLDPGARLDWTGKEWTGAGDIRVSEDGSLTTWGEAA